MAVIVQYVVVRDGEEKMTFATKKEADAYDKMLDIADNLYHFFEEESLPLNEEQKEQVSMKLAENADTVLKILKGVKLTKKTAAPSQKSGKPSEKEQSSGATVSKTQNIEMDKEGESKGSKNNPASQELPEVEEDSEKKVDRQREVPGEKQGNQKV